MKSSFLWPFILHVPPTQKRSPNHQRFGDIGIKGELLGRKPESNSGRSCFSLLNIQHSLIKQNRRKRTFWDWKYYTHLYIHWAQWGVNLVSKCRETGASGAWLQVLPPHFLRRRTLSKEPASEPLFSQLQHFIL